MHCAMPPGFSNKGAGCISWQHAQQHFQAPRYSALYREECTVPVVAASLKRPAPQKNPGNCSSRLQIQSSIAQCLSCIYPAHF